MIIIRAYLKSALMHEKKAIWERSSKIIKNHEKYKIVKINH